MEPQELRANVLATASRLLAIDDFRNSVNDTLPSQADPFKWLVTHLETYVQTGRWEHNIWGMDPQIGYRLQGAQDEREE